MSDNGRPDAIASPEQRKSRRPTKRSTFPIQHSNGPSASLARSTLASTTFAVSTTYVFSDAHDANGRYYPERVARP